jgi:hypothetical protein
VRLDDAARDLEARIAARQDDIARNAGRRDELRQSIKQTEALLDEDVRVLDVLKQEVRALDERVTVLRADFSTREHEIRGARHALEGVRTALMQSEVTRATAASDLAHLTSACFEAVGQSIDEVVSAVAAMEEAGELVAPARRVAAVAAPDEDEEDTSAEPSVESAASRRRPWPSELDDSGPLSPERDRRPSPQDRAARPGQHDGDRAVRRARNAPHVPHDPAQGPARLDRADR